MKRPPFWVSEQFLDKWEDSSFIIIASDNNNTTNLIMNQTLLQFLVVNNTYKRALHSLIMIVDFLANINDGGFKRHPKLTTMTEQAINSYLAIRDMYEFQLVLDGKLYGDRTDLWETLSSDHATLSTLFQQRIDYL